MSVDVVIVNYNAGNFLAECVQSVLAEQARHVFVVDNDSHDESLAYLESSISDNGVSIMRNSKNLGFASACNIGARASNADTVLFLNPDCVLMPGALQRMIEMLESDPSVGMVGGLLMNSDGSEQAGGRRAVPTPWRSFVRAFGLHRLAHRWPKLFFDFYLHKQPLPDRPIEVEAISGACMLVKREAVADVGLWDEAYFLHCEDLDWCMRFRREGWKILFVPSARVTHALGVCSGSRPVFVEWHKHKGMLRFYRKFFGHQYPGVVMWLVVAGVWFRFGLISACRMVQLAMTRLGDRRG